MFDDLGHYGIWCSAAQLSGEIAVTVERLGYGTVWVGGSPDGELRQIEELLDATTTLRVATGVVNIWKDPPEKVAASFHRIADRHPGRFLLGIGAGHREATGADYTHPYQATERYLDALDAAAVPANRRVLAALGPKMLKLSARRAVGAHPYLTTPAHTRRARSSVGQAALLAPEQKVVLDADPARALATARARVADPYLKLVNYTNNLRSLGYGDDDLAGAGSDRLIDALVAHGDAHQVAARLHQHRDAGANHVAIQLLTEPGDDPIAGYTSLAQTLFG